MAAAGELCMRCGLCCSGALFTYVALKEDEVGWAERRRLPVLARGEEKRVFDQPCPLLVERKCVDYEERPVACRTFRCKLLRAFEIGEVEMAEALELIARVERLLDKIGPGRHELNPKDVPLDRLLDIGELEAIVTRHFREVDRAATSTPP